MARDRATSFKRTGLFVLVSLPLLLALHFYEQLSLERLRAATIRIVDPDGAPVEGIAVTVAWRALLRGGEWVVGPSDSEGRIELRDSAALRDNEIPAILQSPRVKPWLALGDCDWTPLSEYTEVTVPHLASVAVQLVDDDGRPWPLDEAGCATVSLGERAAGGNYCGGGSTAPLKGDGLFHFLQVPATIEGAVNVGLGLARAQQPLPDLRDATAPQVVRVTMPADLAWFTGTVLDSEDKPVQGKLGVRGSLRGASEAGFSAFHVPADAAGAFRFFVPPSDIDEGFLTLSSSLGSVTVRIPPTAAKAGPIDLGVLRLGAGGS